MKTSLLRLDLAVCAAVAAFSLALPRVLAATFTTNPTADAFVTTGPSGNLSGNNYGGAGALSVAAPGKSRGEFQSVIEFNLAAAAHFFDGQYGTGQWSVESITLALTAVSPGNATFNPSQAGRFQISWMANSGWGEGSGTPTAPTTTGISFRTLPNFLTPQDEVLGTFGFSGGTSGTQTYSLGLGPGLLSDVLAGSNLSLRLYAADSTIGYLFASRSNARNVSGRPLLTIVAVPEPGSFALVAMGAGVLLGMGWVRRTGV